MALFRDAAGCAQMMSQLRPRSHFGTLKQKTATLSHTGRAAVIAKNHLSICSSFEIVAQAAPGCGSMVKHPAPDLDQDMTPMADRANAYRRAELSFVEEVGQVMKNLRRLSHGQT
jgi:hypothetical protein